MSAPPAGDSRVGRGSPTRRRTVYRRAGKRTLDLFLGLVALLLCLPLIALTALLVRVLLGSPMLFAQTRPGFRGKPFTLFKFRTMIDARDERGEALSDEERLTAFGAWLRRTSLDELPELFNVIKGEMSLVGPRPLLMEYLGRYTPHQARRHEVRPGLTGWTQVKGRNSLSWDEKFELDVWYVDHCGLWLDLRILWLTVWTVLKGRGVSAERHATMPKFQGPKR